MREEQNGKVQSMSPRRVRVMANNVQRAVWEVKAVHILSCERLHLNSSSIKMVQKPTLYARTNK